MVKWFAWVGGRDSLYDGHSRGKGPPWRILGTADNVVEGNKNAISEGDVSLTGG